MLPHAQQPLQRKHGRRLRWASPGTRGAAAVPAARLPQTSPSLPPSPPHPDTLPSLACCHRTPAVSNRSFDV
eukprot:364564-Chlamydomonas_euryale.AAC.1